jgi:hypothetical protein
VHPPGPTTEARFIGELMRLAGAATRVEYHVRRRYPDLRRVAVADRSIVKGVRDACLELARAAQALADAENVGLLESGAFYDQRFGPAPKAGFGPPSLEEHLRFIGGQAVSLRYALRHTYPDLRRLPTPVRHAVKDTRSALATLETAITEWTAAAL